MKDERISPGSYMIHFTVGIMHQSQRVSKNFCNQTLKAIHCDRDEHSHNENLRARPNAKRGTTHERGTRARPSRRRDVNKRRVLQVRINLRGLSA
jgi:hypothetical protein